MEKPKSVTKEETALGKIRCGYCDRETNHELLSGWQFMTWHDVPGPDFQTFMTIRCEGCDRVSFCVEHYNSETDREYDDDGQSFVVGSYQQYPPPLKGMHMADRTRHVPSEILRLYRECTLAMSAQQPVLAGIGIRAMVEMIAKNLKAKGVTVTTKKGKKVEKTNLEAKIDHLVEMKKITETQASFLHQLRTMGNKAAHEQKPHTIAELEVALQVIDALMVNAYILPAEVKKLKA